MYAVLEPPPSEAGVLLGERPRPWRWTLDRYHKAVEEGFFRPDERLELINGEVIEKMPQSPQHRRCVKALYDQFEQSVGGGFVVFSQAPITLDSDGEPEPDVLIVRGNSAEYSNRHPSATDSVLVVEVADSTLSFDRTVKQSAYARDGVQEYWILNLREKQFEVYTEPMRSSEDDSLWGYRSIRLWSPGEVLSPKDMPTVTVEIADLFPDQDTGDSNDS
jgi:Uma2 family endonuclease